MFALMAILALLTLPAYGFTFDVDGSGDARRSAPPNGYVGFNLVSHAIAAAMMIPTTFIAGMTLPLMTQCCCARIRRTRDRPGLCGNTVGAIVGVLIAVHLLLPGVGLKGAVLAAASFQLLIAVILQRARAGRARSSGNAGRGCACLLVVRCSWGTRSAAMASGVYRKGQARLPPESEIMFLRDGKTATISLTEVGPSRSPPMENPMRPSTCRPRERRNPDEITMTMAGGCRSQFIPIRGKSPTSASARDLPRNVVLAPGTSSAGFDRDRAGHREAAESGFGSALKSSLHDPRSHIHFEDAKTSSPTSKAPYDVIISEPSNPWVSGVASLFSDEFYGQVTHTWQDGLLVQWVQIYETDMTVVASIVKALSPHSPTTRSTAPTTRTSSSSPR